MKNLTLILALCLIFASTVATGGVYKWTDGNGNTHYGDRKPGNFASEEVNVRLGKPSPPLKEALGRRSDEQPAEAKEDEDHTRRQYDEQRQSNCKIARNNLKTLQRNTRVRIDEGEKQRYLTPEEIAEKQTAMQQLIADSCSDRATGRSRTE